MWKLRWIKVTISFLKCCKFQHRTKKSAMTHIVKHFIGWIAVFTEWYRRNDYGEGISKKNLPNELTWSKNIANFRAWLYEHGAWYIPRRWPVDDHLGNAKNIDMITIWKKIMSSSKLKNLWPFDRFLYVGLDASIEKSDRWPEVLHVRHGSWVRISLSS